jgi:hypothetical protein
LPIKAARGLERSERQTEWRQRSVEKIKASRAGRLEQLRKEGPAIKRATDDYAAFDRGDPVEIVLRDQFVALNVARPMPTFADEPQELTLERQAFERNKELASRPPLTRLVHRNSNALSLYLTAAYVAHIEAKPGRAFTNARHNVRTKGAVVSWCRLAGLHLPQHEPRTRRARVRRALDELMKAGLAGVRQRGGQTQYEGWTLLKDDGSDSPYVVPSAQAPDAVRLPSTFFLRGWHLVLTPGEIAMLLAIMHMHRRQGGLMEPNRQRYIFLPESVRYRTYGLSGEIYLHAQQLYEFGLIHHRDPMPNRRRGKISNKQLPPPAPDADGDATAPTAQAPPRRVPYWFSPALPAAFDRDAFTVVRDTLSAFPIPYRLSESEGLLLPQSVVTSYLELQQARRQR